MRDFTLASSIMPGAETLQRESRELAASAGLLPPLISSGIDMLLTFARTHNPGAGDALDQDCSGAAKHAWHRGIFAVRLAQARAELALARGDSPATLDHAAESLALAGKIGRPKYEILALLARAQAFAALGRKSEAIGEAGGALAVSRRVGDPALLLRSLDALLGLDGADELLRDAHTMIAAIGGALLDEVMRQRFEESEVVQRIRRL